MTEKLYYSDPYIKEFDARVLSVTECDGGFDILLDRSAFFPEEGGQGADTGVIGNAKVTYVYEKEGIFADVIVVDPPRKGCDEDCLSTMVQMQPKRIVYVSCDSATLARDVKYLGEHGYKLMQARIFDNFPQSVHVETVCLIIPENKQLKLEVTMEVNSESNYTPEERATYQKIKVYVKDKYGVNVHTSYIAQVKRMCGLDMGENYNKSKKENPEVKQCPQEKVEYIKDALEYFGVI